MAILLVREQRPAIRRRVQDVLQQEGHSILEAGDRAEVLRHLERSRPAMALIGQAGSYSLDSVDLAREVRSRCQEIPIILFIPESSEELAIAAIKAGVQDYVRQPHYEELPSAVARCLSHGAAAAQIRSASSIEQRPLVGQSRELSRIRDYLYKVAATECSVLITGETGTGKELVAEAVHRNSARRSRPFVVINCAAIPDSLLESELFGYERGAFSGALTASSGRFMEADGGTVFLDEIGDMSLHLQAKMLRAIESKEVQRLGAKGTQRVDIRIVAATNQNLDDLIRAGQFRSDLYFRLAVTQIRLPSLRERPEDIPVLAQFFIEDLNRRLGRYIEGIDAEVLDRLMHHSWPGNVRELRNLIESFSVASDRAWISTDDLPYRFTQHCDGPADGIQEERTRILTALHAAGWNKSKAAGVLRWSRMTLYRKIARYRIVNDHRSSRKEADKIRPLRIGA